MKVHFTEPALQDLVRAQGFIKTSYPGSMKKFEVRLTSILSRLGMWPESAQELSERPGVRMVPLRTFPYVLYYQISGRGVEILHLSHDKRQEWDTK